MPIFKIDEWLDPNHPTVKAYQQRAARQKIDKLTLDIVQEEKKHARKMRIFDWIFRTVCLLVIIWIIVEAAAID